MNKAVSSKVLTLLALTALLWVPAAADAAEAPLVARAQFSSNSLSFSPQLANAGMKLRITGPDGLAFEREFAAGANPSVLASELAGGLVDGSYTWELVLYPALSAGEREQLRRARSAGGKVHLEAFRQSGYFHVSGGAIASGVREEASLQNTVEPVAGAPEGPTALVEADQVINDDLIVTQSLCVGQDCVNGESFGFDTLRLKENNLRIKFQDTSNSASFPTNDWQLTANDTTNGGANKFSIDDIDGGRTPFTIEASAPSHSLYVDDGGRIGLGTSTPVVELQVVNGDTPTLRLEQDGSSGFTAQTFDVAANETNFFVRDATNGSRLPFKILPSAPTNSLFVDSDGDVGLSEASPEAAFHVVDNLGDQRRIVQFENNGTMRARFENTAASGTDFTFRFNNAGWDVTSSISSGSLMALDTPSGNLTIAGGLFANGSMPPPDYVFEEDYPLMPLEELKQFITTHKHLPNIPSADDVEKAGGQVNMTELQRLLLEKVEELTLYTISQQESLSKLAEENAALKQRLEALETQTP